MKWTSGVKASDATLAAKIFISFVSPCTHSSDKYVYIDLVMLFQPSSILLLSLRLTAGEFERVRGEGKGREERLLETSREALPIPSNPYHLQKK